MILWGFSEAVTAQLSSPVVLYLFFNIYVSWAQYMHKIGVPWISNETILMSIISSAQVDS